MLALEEITNTSIIGPWVAHSHPFGMPAATVSKNLDGHREQFIYPSLVHWVEASKVASSRKDLMEAIIFSPSVKEAQRLTRLNKTALRSDWNLFSYSAFSCALSTLCLQRPQFNLQTAPIFEIANALAATGLTTNFLTTALLRFAVWRTGQKVSFIGADLAPEDFVGLRVSKSVDSVGTWTLVSTCNNRTAWQLHDWALAHHIPIQYVGAPTDRMGKSLYTELITASTHVVVCEQRDGRRHDAPLRMVKKYGRKLTLALYEAHSAHDSLL